MWCGKMRELRFRLLLILIVLWSPGAALAQLSPPNKMGVTMGHLHYHVRDVEANKRFWIALGATPTRIGTREVLELPSVMVLLDQADSSGGTEGSVVNHVGFRVPNVAQFMAKMKAAGFQVAPSTIAPETVGNVFTPEGERIELLQDLSENVQFTLDVGPPDRNAVQQKMAVPIILHHIHFYVPEGSVADIKAWYAKVFGAVPGKRYHYEAADLPGVNLNFSGVPTKLEPTKGRMLDHIGFEITNLEAFCKRLEASGVKLDSPYKRLQSGNANAFLTDPWGTNIELTEGLHHP
jgi:catechol 2,3-dioxygenase-like lactoylglutathione lyase family enzyme